MRTHGTPSAYRDGCRCAPCKVNHAERARKRTARKSGNPVNPPAAPFMTKAQRMQKDRERVSNYQKSPAGQAARRARVLRYQARKAGVDHGCVTLDRDRFLRSLPCAYCGAACEHLDHIHPLSKGGIHCLRNLAPSCERCNTSKGDKILEHPPVAPLVCPLDSTA